MISYMRLFFLYLGAAAIILPGLVGAETLESRLLSSELEIHQKASDDLQKLPLESKKLLVPASIRALKDPNKDIRCHAAYTLDKIGPVSDEAVSSLVTVFKEDAEFYPRQCAIMSLVRMSQAVDENPEYKSRLRQILPVCVAALQFQASESVKNERRAARAEKRIRSEGLKCMASLMTDKDADLLPHAILALADGDQEFLAAKAIKKLGPVAKSAVAQLIAVLDSPKSHHRSAAADALGAIGPAAKEAVPALIGKLKDSVGFVRSSAAEALGNIGPEAKDAVPALKELSSDSDSKWRAEEALKKITVSKAAE